MLKFAFEAVSAPSRQPQRSRGPLPAPSSPPSLALGGLRLSRALQQVVAEEAEEEEARMQRRAARRAAYEGEGRGMTATCCGGMTATCCGAVLRAAPCCRSAAAVRRAWCVHGASHDALQDTTHCTASYIATAQCVAVRACCRLRSVAASAAH